MDAKASMRASCCTCTANAKFHNALMVKITEFLFTFDLF